MTKLDISVGVLKPMMFYFILCSSKMVMSL